MPRQVGSSERGRHHGAGSGFAERAAVGIRPRGPRHRPGVSLPAAEPRRSAVLGPHARHDQRTCRPLRRAPGAARGRGGLGRARPYRARALLRGSGQVRAGTAPDLRHQRREAIPARVGHPLLRRGPPAGTHHHRAGGHGLARHDGDRLPAPRQPHAVHSRRVRPAQSAGRGVRALRPDAGTGTAVGVRRSAPHDQRAHRRRRADVGPRHPRDGHGLALRPDGRPFERAGEVIYLELGGTGPADPDAPAKRHWFEQR